MPHLKRERILQKLGIDTLNSMQEESLQAISLEQDVVLLSPTGTL